MHADFQRAFKRAFHLADQAFAAADQAFAAVAADQAFTAMRPDKTSVPSGVHHVKFNTHGVRERLRLARKFFAMGCNVLCTGHAVFRFKNRDHQQDRSA